MTDCLTGTKSVMIHVSIKHNGNLGFVRDCLSVYLELIWAIKICTESREQNGASSPNGNVS